MTVLKRSHNDQTFMFTAEIIAKASLCKRSKIGSVIVKEDTIISTGYNYVPSMCKVCFREGATKGQWTGKEQCPVIHAEMLAIVRAARYGISLQNSTMYNTYVPCMPCAKAIVHSGIKRLVYRDTYPNYEEVVNYMVQEGVVVHGINGGDPYKDISKDTPLQVDS